MNNLSLNQPKKHRFLIIFGAVILVAGIGFGAYTLLKHVNQPSSTITPGATPPTVPKPTDKLAVEPHDQDPGAQQHGIEGTKTSDESAGTAAFPTTQPNLVVEINEAKRSGNQFAVSGTITPKATGSCTVELTRTDAATLSKNLSLSEGSNSSSCNTALDISAALRGDWTLTIKVQVGSNVATASRGVTF